MDGLKKYGSLVWPSFITHIVRARVFVSVPVKDRCKLFPLSHESRLLGTGWIPSKVCDREATAALYHRYGMADSLCRKRGFADILLPAQPREEKPPDHVPPAFRICFATVCFHLQRACDDWRTLAATRLGFLLLSSARFVKPQMGPMSWSNCLHVARARRHTWVIQAALCSYWEPVQMFENNGVVFPSFLCFVALYLCFAPFFKTSKQRSWILTGLSSGFTSLAAIPYFCDFLASGGHFHALRPATFWSNTVVAIFQGYLVSLISWSDRYFIASILHWRLAGFIIYSKDSSKIPTLILALGSLNKRFRSDYLFAGVFFSTRILLHVALIVAYAGVYLRKADGMSRRSEVDFPTISETNQTLADVQNITIPKSLNSPLPTLFFLAALPMHCMWFAGCVRRILRRRVKVNGTKTDVPIVFVSTSAFRTRFQAIRGRLRLDYEARERLRARVQAAYGNAQERVWRRGVRPAQVVVAYTYLYTRSPECLGPRLMGVECPKVGQQEKLHLAVAARARDVKSRYGKGAFTQCVFVQDITEAWL
ncbi:hypothetical protein AG1IA_08361 [Rhizoctonia solani AG-1 IA]|uniref:Uncharacterized protein n=1 Tax=Thanatephorus cucumeris (strain AG1-IA) TaxID=983506 RepID=L8WHB2_THACA|nr:hypothetical protein AG1IA_08361 [Rhizoctonia solani AG-1 IA]